MKHKTKSASPGELAYSIDDPPRPVSTSENSSMEDVYLSAVLEYPACSLNGLWQQNNSDHGRTVPIAVPPSSPRRYFAMSLLRCLLQFDLRISLISFPMARAARTEDQDEGVRSFDPHQALD